MGGGQGGGTGGEEQGRRAKGRMGPGCGRGAAARGMQGEDVGRRLSCTRLLSESADAPWRWSKVHALHTDTPPPLPDLCPFLE
jgi:hypothetical protein